MAVLVHIGRGEDVERGEALVKLGLEELAVDLVHLPHRARIRDAGLVGTRSDNRTCEGRQGE